MKYMKRRLGAAVLFACVISGALAPLQARADDTVVIQAQGNPNLIDFYSLSNKRADLRVNAAAKGLDTAFSQWLRFERPHLYKQYVDKLSPATPGSASVKH